MSIFTARHYDWLANFAAANLSATDAQKLTKSLSAENPNFNRDKFRARLFTYMMHLPQRKKVGEFP